MSCGLYEKVLALGISHDHHESDLYIPVNEQTRALIREYPYRQNVTTFRCQIDLKIWYDVPFAYSPFWDKVSRRGNREDHMTRTTATLRIASHTPTPWYYDQPQGEIKGANGKPVAYVFVHEAGELGQGVTGANAAHIVRCVNLHEGLVEALQNLLSLATAAQVRDVYQDDKAVAIHQAQAVLTRATQEEE